MLNSKLRIPCALLAAAIFSLSGCRKSVENSTTATPQNAPAPAQAAPAAPAPKERYHRLFTSGVSPLIVSMSPETITFHNGNAPMGRYSLTYEINGSEKATKAYISVYARGVGEVQRFDVDVQPRGSIEFLLDASNVDLGPTVRFRAHCPYGDTGWFIMGSDPMPYPQISSTSQIGNIVPDYVERGRQISGGVPVRIAGAKLSRGCTTEAQVDGVTVELQNVVASDQRINALLPYDSLQGRPVTVRHLEVNLVVNGPGMPAEDTYNLNYVE